jgi:hypothetical protein
VGLGPSNDVQYDNYHSDSQLSDTDRAALEYAKTQREEAEHRKWALTTVGKLAKWIAAAVGFGTLVADAGKRLWDAIGR